MFCTNSCVTNTVVAVLEVEEYSHRCSCRDVGVVGNLDDADRVCALVRVMRRIIFLRNIAVPA